MRYGEETYKARVVPQDPDPEEITFKTFGKEVGKITFGEDGTMTFEGQVKESAQILFDHLVSTYNTELGELRYRLESLEK